MWRLPLSTIVMDFDAVIASKTELCGLTTPNHILISQRAEYIIYLLLPLGRTSGLRPIMTSNRLTWPARNPDLNPEKICRNHVNP